MHCKFTLLTSSHPTSECKYLLVKFKGFIEVLAGFSFEINQRRLLSVECGEDKKSHNTKARFTMAKPKCIQLIVLFPNWRDFPKLKHPPKFHLPADEKFPNTVWKQDTVTESACSLVSQAQPCSPGPRWALGDTFTAGENSHQKATSYVKSRTTCISISHDKTCNAWSARGTQLCQARKIPLLLSKGHKKGFSYKLVNLLRYKLINKNHLGSY